METNKSKKSSHSTKEYLINRRNNPGAFPLPQYGSGGMSLRDYFANSAMQGLLSNPNWMKDYQGEKYIMQKEIISSFSYEIADAMLKERAK